MWILNFFPHWIFHVVLFGTVIITMLAYIFGKLPYINKYAIIVKILGILCIALLLFIEGAVFTFYNMSAESQRVQQQADQFKKDSDIANDKLAQKSQEIRTKIKVKTEVVTKYIDREVTKYDTKFLPGGECEIPKEFIKAINDAANKDHSETLQETK